MEQTVLIQDSETEEVYGILRVKGHTREEIWECLNNTRKELEGEWSIEDLIENIPSDWDFTYTTDFSVYNC